MTRPTRIALLALAVSALVARPTVAAEDGGTVSVFAEPAGPRALGMGGAYAAVGDDATAWMWNPAALALVRRGEFLLASTRPDVLDYREQLASFAQPNWRWGTFGVTWRQFGVSGLDVRDPRNVVLAEDQSFRQSEVALAYARSLGEVWSFGVSTRWRHLELVGRSANALGADVGVVVRPAALVSSPPAWLQDLSLGTSVQNLVRPSARLDLEDVPDPRSARVGLAWRPVTARLPALLALDLQKTDGRSTRLRAGAELAVHPALAVRAGMNAARLAAGTSLRRGNLSVDYAFEDGPIAAAHHVAVSIRFGATVAEAREAAQRARNQEVQQRLEEAFEARRQERVQMLLGEATSARGRGDPELALERLATLRALEPDHPGAPALEAACLLDRARQTEAAGDTTSAALLYARALTLAPGDLVAAAGAERCRAVGDRRAARSAQLAAMYAQAIEALASDDLVGARRGFAAVLEVQPEDAQSRAMLERTEQAIARRVAQMLDQAERFARTGLDEPAREMLERARALDPRSARATRLQSMLASPRRARVPLATASDSAIGTELAARPRRDMSSQEQREMSDDYRRGIAALQRGAHADAVRLLELVWSRDPSYRNVAAALKREYQTRGMDAFAAGRYEEAIAHWENGLRMDPGDDRVRAYLSRARLHLARRQELAGP